VEISAGIQASLAGRYAVALFELASEDGVVSPVETDLDTLAAALDAGLSEDLALRAALAAGALQVTRRGTADVMPDRAEVETFLNRPA
jgi:hypothetical protein